MSAAVPLESALLTFGVAADIPIVSAQQQSLTCPAKKVGGALGAILEVKPAHASHQQSKDDAVAPASAPAPAPAPAPVAAVLVAVAAAMAVC